MKLFSMKKKKNQRKDDAPLAAFVKENKAPVTVRVEPPGYSTHEFPRVLPASDLRSPHFASLMAKADVEYGVHGRVVVIPCKLDDFLLAMVNTTTRVPFHPPVGAEAAPVDEPSSPRRRNLGWFLARSP